MNFFQAAAAVKLNCSFSSRLWRFVIEVIGASRFETWTWTFQVLKDDIALFRNVGRDRPLTWRHICLNYIRQVYYSYQEMHKHRYRGADKSLVRPGRKQANVSVRIAWISIGALPCRKRKPRWQLASRCCWNCARPWHGSELLSFLVGLRTYQHPCIKIFYNYSFIFQCVCAIFRESLTFRFAKVTRLL